jgi:hypothetical protein
MGVIDESAQFRIRQATAERDRVPVFLVHVVTRLHFLVAIAQVERELGIALQIHLGRDIIERGDGKDFRANFEDERVLAKRRALAGIQFR